jgi:mannose-1-phosphate guanylyltransferase/phosphomannomutase
MVGALKNIVIMAGGRGTRSSNPDIPKSLQLILNKTIIEWQLENIARDISAKVWVIGGYKGQSLQNHLMTISHKFPNLILEYLQDDELNGTLKALYRFSNQIEGNELAILLGDVIINFDWRLFFDNLKEKNVDALIVTHPNNHPNDSDVLIDSQFDSQLTVLPKKRLPNDFDGNQVFAGVYGIKKNILQIQHKESSDLADLFRQDIFEKYRVQNYKSVDYLKDSGTKNRILEIENDILFGNFEKRNPINRSVIFIDFDNTLHKNIEVKKKDTEINLNPLIVDSIRKLNKNGIPIVVITNQPGIAKNFFSLSDLEFFFRRIQSQLAKEGCFIDAWYFCPHHPETGWAGENIDLKIVCNCRKPKVGLIEKFAKTNRFNPSKSWFVGDSIRDRELAQSAGLNFICSRADEEDLNHLCGTSSILSNLAEILSHDNL